MDNSLYQFVVPYLRLSTPSPLRHVLEIFQSIKKEKRKYIIEEVSGIAASDGVDSDGIGFNQTYLICSYFDRQKNSIYYGGSIGPRNDIRYK